MSVRALVIFFVLAVCVARADEVLYRYEGDVLPYSDSGAWVIADACAGACSETIEAGRFVLRWAELAEGNPTNYHLWIARQGETQAPSLWVEWRFCSNRAIGRNFFDCDGRFAVRFRDVFDAVYLYGDAAIALSGSDSLTGLELDEFHTYRFESPDGVQYSFYVDGTLIWASQALPHTTISYLQFGGDGGCNSDWIPNMVNEWDFVRYGTIGFGEKIASSDPPGGFLDPDSNAGVNRLVVTYDQPSYAYIDDITVEVTGGIKPNVVATRRREPPDPLQVDDDPRILEIVLDRPIPTGHTTRFIFNDGEVTNVMRYTLQWGDTDGSGSVDLLDVAFLQNCFGLASLGDCAAFDVDRTKEFSLPDVGTFVESLLQGPTR